MDALGTRHPDNLTVHNDENGGSWVAVAHNSRRMWNFRQANAFHARESVSSQRSPSPCASSSFPWLDLRSANPARLGMENSELITCEACLLSVSCHMSSGVVVFHLSKPLSYWNGATIALPKRFHSKRSPSPAAGSNTYVWFETENFAGER